ncbi:hypothetical protein HNR23_004853 [Nocardiopsis mwathae]|uniref:Transcriptional regulator n=1 Tax=Nocardiopsis mwathae TaxID=1472723 RepID=A0A7W9YMB5_9ACTN|nr:hypothetical protein [Nocardiopsis mwathae]MBB6174793.1 hypothetical protein [Nocardiopsis mwathae]
MAQRPNLELRNAISRAGLSGDALARRVNTIGAEAGLRLAYGRASVSQWLSGARPRPPVPELVAEALARRIGRHLTPADIGWPAPEGTRGSAAWWEADPLDLIADLYHRESSGGTTAHPVYNMAALDVPMWAPSVHRSPYRPHHPVRIGQTEAASATAMLHLAIQADDAFGGGAMRSPLVGYLATMVGPWLRSRANGEVRRRLLTSGARLSCLTGFMYFDDGLHGAAQRYYRIALRLTAESGDTAGHSVTLRAMSSQACALGHPRAALHLAQAGVTALSEVSAPCTRALLLGQLAVVHARNGEQQQATHLLAAAEHMLRRTTGPRCRDNGYYTASLAHQRADIAASSGDRSAAVTSLAECLRHLPEAKRRYRALCLARLAELKLDSGCLDGAAADWHRFLDDYPALRSGRARAALSRLRARLRPFARSSTTRDLLHRAVTVSEAAAHFPASRR